MKNLLHYQEKWGMRGCVFVTSMWPNYVQSWRQVGGIVGNVSHSFGDLDLEHKRRSVNGKALVGAGSGHPLAPASQGFQFQSAWQRQSVRTPPDLFPSEILYKSGEKDSPDADDKDDDDNQRQTNKLMFLKEGIHSRKNV